jgi:adenylate kinase family enzyme
VESASSASASLDQQVQYAANGGGNVSDSLVVKLVARAIRRSRTSAPAGYVLYGGCPSTTEQAVLLHRVLQQAHDDNDDDDAKDGIGQMPSAAFYLHMREDAVVERVLSVATQEKKEEEEKKKKKHKKKILPLWRSRYDSKADMADVQREFHNEWVHIDGNNGDALAVLAAQMRALVNDVYR